MKSLPTFKVIRLTKAILVLTVGIYALLVFFNNVTDYDSNFQFVRHVLSMDTTFLDNQLMYRAITSPVLHHIAYLTIILFEGLIAFLCLKGSYQLFKHVHADGKTFHEAKRLSLIALTCCCLLWFFGFQVVGGEWFAMWMSSKWNGLSSAFRLVTYMLLVLIFVSLKNDDESSS
ncbi:DUF2165 family protein [Thermoflavimicrobium daqui]|jgi:predicted small integral membrane protein|uniref:DUF2165 domain-containing protein n=1 Tax=Thermoflavimicrobium daqui TaxID=2137476 RepID=A0A364K129_9BACL|nr:DUF2165 domain-containing protein [Thermoflavimicrobium daqui]RAL21391.1 hypothetical protein DL897_16765 [Thermoflavimicrobium daqui]